MHSHSQLLDLNTARTTLLRQEGEKAENYIGEPSSQQVIIVHNSFKSTAVMARCRTARRPVTNEDGYPSMSHEVVVTEKERERERESEDGG